MQDNKLQVLISRCGYKVRNFTESDFQEIADELSQVLTKNGIFDVEFYYSNILWEESPYDVVALDKEKSPNIAKFFKKLNEPDAGEALSNQLTRIEDHGLVSVSANLHDVISDREWQGMGDQLVSAVNKSLPDHSQHAQTQASGTLGGMEERKVIFGQPIVRL